jgi:hypothetical protein
LTYAFSGSKFACKESWTQEREQLLKRKFAEFGLKLEGTRLEPLVQQLYRELDSKGIHFHPPVYLADEWGCPEAIPIIGIPFYLADERLLRLEDEIMEGIEAESDDDISSYLRHEAGHALHTSCMKPKNGIICSVHIRGHIVKITNPIHFPEIL